MENTIENRYDFMYLLQAVNCNPNGDPDRGNLPRQDEETELGYITDVAIKRRDRNYIDEAFKGQKGMDILARKGTSINRKIAEAVFETNGFEKVPAKFKNTKVVESANTMLERYWDLRAFGGVLSTGLNAGQIRGAVQLGIACSVDPIHVEDITVTRMYYTDTEGKNFSTLDDYKKEEEERPDNNKRTMGTKKFISYGLYVVKGCVSANLAAKNGFTNRDLNAFWEASLQAYNFDASSSKFGMSVVSPLIIFKHVGTQGPENKEQNAREAMLGCAPDYKLYRLLNIEKKEGIEYPRRYEDYKVLLDLRDLPNGVVAGIKTEPFAPVIWGSDKIASADPEDLTVAI